MFISLFLSMVVINSSPVLSDTENVHGNKRSDDYIPCENRWYYFRDKCYRSVGRKQSERLTWSRALARCRDWRADLVSIQSQEEQEFITAFLQLDIQYWAWTGLNDRENETDYKWSDGSFFNYTNWKDGEPTGFSDDVEDCMHLVFEPGTDNVGKWNDRACDVSEGYICEMNANPSKRSPNPMYCSSEEGGGWKYQTSCYHVVTEMKSWQNAEKYCNDNYNGHLVTIRDTLEDIFLEYILENMRREVWIGIKIQDQLQQKWASGWYVSYNGFSKEDSFHFVEGTCVARKTKKEWVMIPCSRQLSFICEVTKASPPILKLPPVGAHCPAEFREWRDLGGEYCYYIETTKGLKFHEASFECKRRGGDLVSLHSKEEADILRPFVQYTQWSIFIGLVRLFPNEDKFAWTDGSALDYENWNHNEPNSEQEKCVEAVTHDIIGARKMGWNDITCEHQKAYICSVKKSVPNASVVEETNGCASHVLLQALIGVSLSLVLVIVLLGLSLYYIRNGSDEYRKNSATASRALPSLSIIFPRYNRPTELTLKEDSQYETMT